MVYLSGYPKYCIPDVELCKNDPAWFLVAIKQK